MKSDKDDSRNDSFFDNQTDSREEKNTVSEETLSFVRVLYNTLIENEVDEIYANQLTRSGFPAMQKTAEMILANHRAQEADAQCMSIKQIITLIPDEV